MSFDDGRRASSARRDAAVSYRASSRAGHASGASRTARGATLVEYPQVSVIATPDLSWSSPFRQQDSRAAAPARSRAAAGSPKASRATARRASSTAYLDYTAPSPAPAGRASRRSASAFATPAQAAPLRSASRRRPASQPRSAFAQPEDDQFEIQDQPASSLKSKLEGLKQSRTKSRAEKQFNRQYAGPRTASATAEAAPRAAVYKGEMGTQHKKATRMQGEPAAQAGVKTARSRAQKRPFFYNPFFIIATGVVACVLFACMFLYPTAQQYYLSLRSHDQLQAEYDAVTARNNALQQQINSLSSEEGLKQYVHDQYGWVSPGENAVVVQGLSDGSENGLSGVAANVVAGSVKAPDTWYSGVLDPFFGYTQ